MQGRRTCLHACMLPTRGVTSSLARQFSTSSRTLASSVSATLRDPGPPIAGCNGGAAPFAGYCRAPAALLLLPPAPLDIVAGSCHAMAGPPALAGFMPPAAV